MTEQDKIKDKLEVYIRHNLTKIYWTPSLPEIRRLHYSINAQICYKTLETVRVETYNPEPE